MSVKRWEFDVNYGGMAVDVGGDFIHVKDYAKLEQEHKAAMLTISNITKLLGVSDAMSVSEQVAELVEQNLKQIEDIDKLKEYVKFLERCV